MHTHTHTHAHTRLLAFAVGRATTSGFKVVWEPPADPEDPIVCFMLEMDEGQRMPQATKVWACSVVL